MYQKTAVERCCFGAQGLIVAPTLVLGGTDSWHYQNISGGNILLFDGMFMNRTAGDGSRVRHILLD